MTIKTYLAHLEKIKEDLLALDLPENTRLVNPPDMGSMTDFGDVFFKFNPQEVYLRDTCCYAYEYLGMERLKKKENVVVVKYGGYSR